MSRSSDHILLKEMIRITIEREKIIKSLKELEREYKTGKIPERHYNAQKQRLNEQLETLEVADRVRRLQGKETVETPVDDYVDEEEQENEELFKKYITSPGLKEKKLESKKPKGMSQNKMIAASLLAVAFIIGIGFGVFTLDLPTDISSALYTNDSAFPPFVVNNTTNMTNTTNTTNMTNTTNTTKKLNTTVTKPKPTTNTNTTTPTNPPSTDDPSEQGINGGAGDPSETKTNTKPGNISV
jgi:hypothetical protein